MNRTEVIDLKQTVLKKLRESIEKGLQRSPHFNDIIEISTLTESVPFSMDGDSGALVFSEDEHFAVGLVFAGVSQLRHPKEISYVCGIKPILEWAEADLIN